MSLHVLKGIGTMFGELQDWRLLARSYS